MYCAAGRDPGKSRARGAAGRGTQAGPERTATQGEAQAQDARRDIMSWAIFYLVCFLIGVTRVFCRLWAELSICLTCTFMCRTRTFHTQRDSWQPDKAAKQLQCRFSTSRLLPHFWLGLEARDICSPAIRHSLSRSSC